MSKTGFRRNRNGEHWFIIVNCLLFMFCKTLECECESLLCTRKKQSSLEYIVIINVKNDHLSVFIVSSETYKYSLHCSNKNCCFDQSRNLKSNERVALA